MFEIIGLATLRLYGYGWLWGKERWRANKVTYDEVFGIGGSLMIIGLASTLHHFIAALLICAAIEKAMS